MALLRTFRLGIVFAIGFWLGPAQILAGAVNSSDAHLSIQLKDPEDVVAVKGQSASLQCHVVSPSSDLDISWLHNDKEIPGNDTRRRVQDDGSLYFPKVVGGRNKGNGLAGEYRCLARNNASAVLSNPAKFKIASIDHDFTRQPSNQSVPESQPAVLFCNIHSVPPAQIKWEHNTVPLPHDTRYVPLPTGALLITKTHSSDAGLYSCIATNSLLKKPKHSKIVELRVESPAATKAAAPTFLPLDISLNTTVLVGKNATLYCAVSGWPTPTVQWLNDDSIVISNSSILRIDNAALRDAGNYTCLAYNSEGRGSLAYKLQVHQPPYFNVTPISKTYPSAKTVRLDCQAKGVPQPRIHWLKNGAPLNISGRIKRMPTGLVFSHTFTHDAGIYQCVAVNSVGRVWVASELVLAAFNSPFPSPPRNVQCRTYDDSHVCLTWRAPENLSVQAYSIYSFHTDAGMEIPGPEYLTNMTYHLADRLNRSTNYSFYIRLYSDTASDQSKTVRCETGVKGRRNLQLTPIDDTSVALSWSKMSTDSPCDGSKSLYRVQWKRKGRSVIKGEDCDGLKRVVTGLRRATDYEFSVISASYKSENYTWTPLVTSGANASDPPAAPDNLRADALSATTVSLAWSDPNGNARFFSICYVNTAIEADCEDGQQITNISDTRTEIKGLKPSTRYEFRVRAHLSDTRVSPFSEATVRYTLADVPTGVVNLTYQIVNETTACVGWFPPLHNTAKINKYVIGYTPDRNRLLPDWDSKILFTSQMKSKACWNGDKNVISILLTDLEADKKYMVLVRASTDIGVGDPTVPIEVMTGNIKSFTGSDDKNNGDSQPESEDSLANNQKFGIIMGVIIGLLCVIMCLCVILLRRRCLKSRLARPGVPENEDYFSAVAHYATEGNSVRVRLDPYTAAAQEIEHLVDDVPPITLPHLDTKGTDGFPNGHLNGAAKPYMNGDVHITENPQYYVFSASNGHAGGRPKPRSGSGAYEEDPNSNVKTSKFQDLQRIFESSKQSSPVEQRGRKSSGRNECNPLMTISTTTPKSRFRDASLSSSEDDCCDSANVTQVTCLDNSLRMPANHRRVSPILGPNG